MKEYMKMSDVFNVNVRVSSCIADGFTYYGLCGDDITHYASFNGNGNAAKYSSHAINSHDELVKMNEELLAALEGCAKELAWIIDQHNEQNMEDGSWKYDYQTPGEAMQLVFKAKGGAE